MVLEQATTKNVLGVLGELMKVGECVLGVLSELGELI